MVAEAEQQSAEAYINGMEEEMRRQQQGLAPNGPQGEPPPPAPVWKSIKPYHTDAAELEDMDEEGDGDDESDSEGESPSTVSRVKKDWCYLCSYGQLEQNMEKNEYHQSLIKLMLEQYNLCSTKEYTTLVQSYYNAFVRPCIEKRTWQEGYTPMVWRRAVIHEHYQRHVMNPGVVTYDISRTLFAAMQTIRDHGLFQREELSGEQRVDPKNFKMYMELVKHVRPMLSLADATRNSNTV